MKIYVLIYKILFYKYYLTNNIILQICIILQKTTKIMTRKILKVLEVNSF